MGRAELKDRIWIPRERRDPFSKEVGRPSFIVVLAVLLLAGDWLGKNIVFDPPAKWLGDILLRTRKAEVPRYTRLIRIDEEDREKILRGKTPVEGPALLRALCALAVSKPSVIVVDLDTSSEKSFPPEIKSLPDMGGVKVVWAVSAHREQVEQKLVLKSGRFLGGNILGDFGVAKMPAGFDGVVREWYRTVEVNGVQNLSLTAKAVQRHCEGRTGCQGEQETSFAVDYIFPVMHLREFVTDLKSASKDGGVACVAAESKGADPRLKDMPVVLGAIHEHEDRHDTAWGAKAGSELVAMSIEESLNPHSLGQLHWLGKWVLKIALALGVAALHHYFWPIAATVLTLLLLPIAILCTSLAAFWFGDYQLATVPLVVGILLEQLATSAEKGDHHARNPPHH